MKENEDHIKDLLRKGGLESPSGDFTEQVIDKIEALPAAKKTGYVPIFGKKAWLAAAIIGIAVIVTVLTAGESSPKETTQLNDWLGSFNPTVEYVATYSSFPYVVLAFFTLLILVFADRYLHLTRLNKNIE